MFFSPLKQIAGMTMARFLAYALCALAFVAAATVAVLIAKAQLAERHAAEARRDAAVAEAERLSNELEAERRGADEARKIAEAEQARLRELAPKYESLARRVREYEKRPVTNDCRYVMEPFAASVRGLRDIEGDPSPGDAAFGDAVPGAGPAAFDRSGSPRG